MRLYLTIELECNCNQATASDTVVSMHQRLALFVKGLERTHADVEARALTHGVSVVADPCENDGVIQKVMEILTKAKEPADGVRAVLKFCKEYKDAG